MFKSIEEEFMFYAFRHKYNVLLQKMIEYFETIEPEEINLSGAYYKSPEQRAKAELRTLILTNPNKFNSLYEKAII